MAHSNIIEKLSIFLNKQPFTGENDVVYLMVEIGKLMEHKVLPHKYPLLKFYSDWTVHTDKSKITSEIKEIMEDIYKEIMIRILERRHIHKPNVLDFMDMKHLKKDMSKFLADAGLPNLLVTDSRNWADFQILLAKVLIDQPIKNPCVGIKEYRYIITGDPRIIRTETIFEKKPADYGTFDTEERIYL